VSEPTLDEVLKHRSTGVPYAYGVDKLQLYGVGVGLGADHLDERQLRFLRDEKPLVLPSFATVAAWDVGFTLELGMDWSKLIHASQRVVLPGPLPPAASIVADSHVSAAFDKPNINATLLVVNTDVRLADSGQLLAQLESVSLARDFRVKGAPEGRPSALPSPPAREPDGEVVLQTSAQVALVYRLLGGRSLIHFDPDVARAQGFEGPIMHGLSTFGHACHAVVRGACAYDPSKVRLFAANFAGPSYPGETLLTRMWKDDSRVFFETTAAETGRAVLGRGYAELA
jgi:acyl dehydratase